MSISKYLGLAVLGYIAWAAYSNYVEEQTVLAAVAEDYELDETQMSAYEACNSQMSGLQLSPDNPNTKTYNGSVPPSICACQAKQMVNVMNPGAYSSHKLVVDFMRSDRKSTKKELDKSQINSNYSSDEGFYVLLMSLKSCVADYRSERQAEIKKRIDQICRSEGNKDSRLCNS